MSDIVIVEETGDTVIVQENVAADTISIVAVGPQGGQGPTGTTGPAGPGVPVAGSTGQVLTKSSNADYATAWTTPTTGTVTSVAATVPTGLAISGSPITTTGTLAITNAVGYAIPTTASQTNWDTAYTDRLKWDGGATGLTASTGRTSLGLGTIATQSAASVAITGGSITGITDLAIADGGTGASTAANARTNLGLGTIATQSAASVAITGGSITGITDLAIADGGTGASTATNARTNLGATTLGGNLFTVTDPSAVTFPRFNADNTVSSLDAATFRTAIGAGTGSGSVTGVTATSPVASSGGTAPDISLSADYGDTLNPYASKTANNFLAAPNGTAGVPTFRAIVAADIPTLNQNTTGTAANVTGTVAIANGGTGQTSQTAAFDALAPTTTKGDLIVDNGTNNVRLPVGTDTYVLVADSAEVTGVKWAASTSGSSVAIADEGTTLTSAVASINFTGTGVTATNVGSAVTVAITSGGGSGDVVGPASATDNAITRFDLTTGKLIQNSTVTLDDTGNVINANSVGFDTTPGTLPTSVGTMSWDDGDGVPSVILKGGNTTLQVGTQEYARVYNESGATLTKGQVVYISGAQGNRVAVRLARANVEATSFGTIGLVTESIPDGAEGYILVSGALYKLNTSSFTAGAAVYLSPTTAGAITTTKPQAPDQLVVLGWVERVDATVGSIYVKIDNGYELDELHDVQVSSPASGNLLIYDASTSPTGVWKNANLTAGTGVSVTGGAGSITVANTGVLSLTGTTNEVDVSASTGAITLSLPATINADTTGNAANVTGTVAIANGGTGQTTRQAAMDALAGATTSGQYLRGNGTDVVMAAIVAADVPTLNQNTTGTAAGLSSTLAISSGGTGATTLAGASIPTYSSTDTLTNKRITPRVISQPTTTSPWAWDSTSYDQQEITALANALTINADAGTPTDGQKTVFRFQDNGTARALTWTTGTSKSFRAIGVTLPTTTVISKTVYIGCIYNAGDARWDAIAVAQEA